MSLLVKSSNFVYHCHVVGLKFFCTLSFQKCSIAFSLSVSVQVSDAYVNVLSVVVFSLNCSFFDMFLFLKNVCSIRYVLLAFFILCCKSVWLLLSSLIVTPKYLKFTVSQICRFLFSNVLFYFSLNCFSFPLSYILSFLGLSVVFYSDFLYFC